MHFPGDPHTYVIKLVAFGPKLALSITLLWGKFPPSYEVSNNITIQSEYPPSYEVSNEAAI